MTTSRERFELQKHGGGERNRRADDLFNLGPMSPPERAEFLCSIARAMAVAEARRQPHPQQKLDV